MVAVRSGVRGSSSPLKALLLFISFVAGWVLSTLIGCYIDPNRYVTGAPDTHPALKISDVHQDAPPALDISNVQEAVTVCLPLTEQQKKNLEKEITDYEKSPKFQSKIREVQGKEPVAKHHVGIDKYLKEKVLQPGWSVLELGCAAGMMLQMVQRAYEEGIGEHKELVGVELVTGWVKFAADYHKNLKIYEGDITHFELPAPYSTFDFVMFNDVAEHIQKERYGCFFENLKQVTHAGSIVYFHTPTPQAQLKDEDQYLENVLPHHYLVMGMSLAGFELVAFEHDMDTNCVGSGSPSIPRQIREAKCMFNGWPKYYHAVFRKVAEMDVLTLQ